MKIIKPPLLKEGDTIGILAPSGAMDDDINLKRAITFLKTEGIKLNYPIMFTQKRGILQARIKNDWMLYIKCLLINQLMQ